MKKRIYLLALLWLQAVLFPLVAQKNEHDQAFMKIETPTVASFTKFIDHPVDLYNGSPDITVPIYTLKDGAIEIPINLRYHASGIKVGEEAGWAGLGWNLNVGGVIVENIVGKKDNSSFFNWNLDYYPSGTFSNYTQIPYRTNDKNKHDSFFTNAAAGRLQPDIFSFSYPGHSGKFFIDHRTNTIHQLRKDKPVKIEQEYQTWKITTETGIIHYFGQTKNTYQVGQADPVTCTHYLTKTEYPNGQTITYNYTSATLYPYQQTETQTLALRRPTGMGFNETTQHYTIINSFTAPELTLSSIQTDNYNIEFITSSRTDLQNGKKLDEIKISSRQSSWGMTPKRFKFSYDYFVTTTIGNYWRVPSFTGFTFDIEKAKRRLKLLSVHEIIGTSTVHNKYSFDYYTPQLPIKTSYAMDYWGHYNGQTSNTCTTPDFDQLLWGRDLGKQIAVRQRRKANRTYHFESCLAGMLKQVTYPTGGRSVYTYEPNQFNYPRFIPTRQELSQLEETRVVLAKATDKNNNMNTSAVDLILTESTDLIIKLELHKGLNSWNDMQGSRYIIIRSGNFLKNEPIDLTGVSSSDFKVEKEITLNLPAGSYRFIVDLPGSLGNQDGASLKHGELIGTVYKIVEPELTPRNYSVGAGLRVSKVDFYESAANPTSLYNVGYEYTPGVLYAHPDYHRVHSNVSYAVSIRYGSNGEYNIHHIDIEEVEVAGSTLSSTPYSLASGMVGYSKVIERITGTNSTTGHTEYNFFNTGETNASCSVQIPKVSNGQRSSVYRYNQQGIKVSSEQFTYSTTKKHHYWGVNLIDKFNRTPGFFSGIGTLVEGDNRTPLVNYGDYNGRYVTLLYEMGSYETLLTSKETMVDGVTTKELYEYNTHGLLNKTTFTQSDGKANVTQITYPSDYNCGINNTMKTKNMLALPVEKRNIVGGNLVAGSLTEYIARGTDIVPTTLSFASLPASGNPTGYSCSGVVASVYPQKDVRFQTYDARSNPVYVTSDSDATNTVYLWGYNYQYPVAKIENATYTEVRTALSNVDPESLSSAVTPNMTTINGLRSRLPKALITTYTYKPLVGIDSMTSPTGEKTTYEYDTAGRLLRIKDHAGKIIQQFDYNYRP